MKNKEEQSMRSGVRLRRVPEQGAASSAPDLVHGERTHPTPSKASMGRNDTEPEPCLVCVQGPGTGQVWRLLPQATIGIGRELDLDVTVLDHSVSRRHAEIRSEGDVFVLVDLDSTNGVFVNGTRVQICVLNEGDEIRVGLVSAFRFVRQHEFENEFDQNDRSSVCDSLTGAYNRRFFQAILESDVPFNRRRQLPLSVLLIDVDYFKVINDAHGHGVGDRVLKELVGLLRSNLRGEDVLCRYGGEEFAVILRDSSPINAAFVAEKLRRAVTRHAFLENERVVQVTVSIGVATLEGACVNAETLVETADRHLYDAKKSGRNRVATGA